MPTLAQQYPVFQPAMRIISNIFNTNPIYVTTTFKHQYVTGMICRLNIPNGYGMTQANKLSGPITVIDDYSFTMPINAENFDVFATPVAFPDNRQYAQVTVIGELTSMLTAPERNVLPY